MNSGGRAAGGELLVGKSARNELLTPHLYNPHCMGLSVGGGRPAVGMDGDEELGGGGGKLCYKIML